MVVGEREAMDDEEEGGAGGKSGGQHEGGARQALISEDGLDMRRYRNRLIPGEGYAPRPGGIYAHLRVIGPRAVILEEDAMRPKFPPYPGRGTARSRTRATSLPSRARMPHPRTTKNSSGHCLEGWRGDPRDGQRIRVSDWSEDSRLTQLARVAWPRC